MSDKPTQAKAPVLRVTRYDTVSSLLISVVAGLVFIVAWLILIWLTNRLPEAASAPQVMWMANPGGFADGTAGDTLGGDEGPTADIADIESVEEMEDDPMVQEMESEDANSTETLDNIVELSELGAQQVQQMVPENQLNVGEKNDGVRRKYKGTGKKPLGEGAGVGGFGREQRWFVRFADGGTLDEYARQLDFFKIELGAYVPGGKLTYLNNASQPQPTTRAADVSADEQRLYMTWTSAGRREADVQIFRNAGIDATNAVIMHFYPPETENQLGEAETKYRGRAVADILRTYFVVRPNGADGYLFVVTAQTYIR